MALQEISINPKIRAVVIASSGEYFAGGADLAFTRECHDDPALAARVIHDGKVILSSILATPQPIIAALHADVVGVTCTIALACDIAVAARNIRLIDPHIRIGLAAGDGAGLVWPLSAGMQRAKRHLLTGDPLSAEEAYNLGLISDLVDSPEDVFDTAVELAQRIASYPPLAVQGTKSVLNNLIRMRAAEIVELGFMHTAATIRSEDLVEAIDAFLAHRVAVYQGK